MAGALIDRIAEGKRRKAELKQRFGGIVPTSILRITRGALSRSMFQMQSEVPNGNRRANPDDPNTQERAALGVAPSRFGAGDNTEQTSIMPAELVEFALNFYRPDDEHLGEPARRPIYVDPFAGQGVQMQVAHRMGWDYYATDVSKKHLAYIEAVRRKIDTGTPVLRVVEQDARFIQLAFPGLQADVCFTSPPYWDIEFYGDEPEQLGTGKSYVEFLQGIVEQAGALRACMAPHGYCVVNVNDFRRKGEFYPYHCDTVSAYQAAGWTLHDVWIVDGLVAGLARMFAADKASKKMAARMHEYLLVFRP